MREYANHPAAAVANGTVFAAVVRSRRHDNGTIHWALYDAQDNNREIYGGVEGVPAPDRPSGYRGVPAIGAEHYDYRTRRTYRVVGAEHTDP